MSKTLALTLLSAKHSNIVFTDKLLDKSFTLVAHRSCLAKWILKFASRTQARAVKSPTAHYFAKHDPEETICKKAKRLKNFATDYEPMTRSCTSDKLSF